MSRLKKSQPQAPFILEHVSGHRNGEFEVALLAASASENDFSKQLPGNGKLFKQRIEKLVWSDLPIVLMPTIVGLSYFEFSFWHPRCRSI